MGTSFGWTIGGGSRINIRSSQLNSSNYMPGGSRYNSSIANSHSSIVTSGNDSNLPTLMPNIVYRALLK
ncbi:unnamed protein product [Rotaria sp. Silwood1]|nr:unnamed protein product [Rotaria sp. Silwood1]